MSNQHIIRPSTDPETIRVRRIKVLECRRRFLTWDKTADEISEWLGYKISISQCAEDLRVLVRQRSAELHEDIDSARAVMVDQLDSVMVKLAEHAGNGSLDHAETLLKFIARKAKLLGADAPTRTESLIDDRRERLKPEQILERMALIQARLKARTLQELPAENPIDAEILAIRDIKAHASRKDPGQVLTDELDPVLRKDAHVNLAESSEEHDPDNETPPREDDDVGPQP